jgi:oligoendopeptidase F
MSKKHKTASKFPYIPGESLPPLKSIKTEWDLKKHYYKSAKDPQIEADANAHEAAVLKFIKKYKAKDFTATAKGLAVALNDYEVLARMVFADKIMRYFGFRTTLDVNDTEATKLSAQYSDRFRKLGNQMLFFGLTIGKIPPAMQKQYLKDPVLKPYHYYLSRAFATAKHHLSEAEEKILNLTSSTSSDMWQDATEKILGNRHITFKGKRYSIPEALESIDIQTWENKQKLWDLIVHELRSVSEFAEHELSAIINHEKVEDELRGFKTPYSGTVLGYENNEQSVEALVSAISTKGFALSRKFYAAKAAIHKKATIPYVNKYDPIGEVVQPNFNDTVLVCRDTFYSVKKEYGECFDEMLQQGQIDVFPKKGKRGGAFMSATVGLPTFVMLNHTNSFKSLETLAHEMGHAIHATRSKQQPVLYEGFSTTTAETASTLFEQLMQQKLFAQLSERDQYIFLHDKICRDIATVQRQIACFNFELEMHQHIRKEGIATKEELASMMTKHLRAYLGPAVTVTEDDGYSFVYWPHIRYGFYVYTYTYGILMSNLMARRYEADPRYVEKIDTFLSAGGSDTVENVFKRIGINALSVDTFLESLKNQEEDIALFIKLSKKYAQ